MEIIDGVVKVFVDYFSVLGVNFIFFLEVWFYDF